MSWQQAKETIPQQELLEKKINEIDLLLPSYDELDEKLDFLTAKEEELKEAEENQTAAQERVDTLSSEIAALKEEHKSLENAAVVFEQLTAHRSNLVSNKEALDTLIGDIKELETQQKKLRTLQESYLTACSEMTRLQGIYDTKNKAFLDEQAGILASGLVSGSPCPVCGSTEHPHPAILSEGAPTEADVKQAEQALEVAKTEMVEANKAASTQNGKVSSDIEKVSSNIQVLLGDISVEEAGNVAAERVGALSDDIKKVDEDISAADKKKKRKAQLDTQLPEKESALVASTDELNSLKAEIASLNTAVEQLKKNVEELKKKLPYESRSAAEAERDALAEKKDALKKALNDAEVALKNKSEALAGVQSAAETLRKQLAGKQDVDLEGLTEQKDLLTQERDQLIEEQNDVGTRLSVNVSARDNIAAKAAETTKLEQRYAWVKALSDTANGSVSGKDKVMLETYIQTTYFDRILERANLRLRKMSGGQYDLKRREEADNKKAQSGLDLNIVDHINATERSVNTLSGGESFLASLALALGLSDEVQASTGIRLDTLFVDEGFGSLDPEALSKAYNTLAGLTDGNRLVGIISHVAELKEKIEHQIAVKKDRNGASRASIEV